MSSVLVLNQDFSPLSTAQIPRAMSLIGRGAAEMLEHGVLPISTPSREYERPSVIRLFKYIRRPTPHARYTRHNVFKRDGFQCQYCDGRPKELTIDHVIPLSRGGADFWENVVASCRACNHKKGARTPEEARMPLKRKPSEPHISSYLHLLGVEARPEWKMFLPA